MYTDPTGHYVCEGVDVCTPSESGSSSWSWSGASGSSGGTGGGGSGDGGGTGGNSGSNEGGGINYGVEVNAGIIEFGVNSSDSNLTASFRFGNESCNSSCQQLAEALSIGATALDTFAAGANTTLAVVIYGTALVDPPLGAALLLDWKPISVITNGFGTVGTLAWAGQGFLTGSNKLGGEVTFSTDSPVLVDTVTISGGISQDTMASAVLDLASWAAPEPISTAGASIAGAGYDWLRNPAPSLLPYNGIPSVLDITYSASVDLTP